MLICLYCPGVQSHSSFGPQESSRDSRQDQSVQRELAGGVEVLYTGLLLARPLSHSLLFQPSLIHNHCFSGSAFTFCIKFVW